MALVRCNACGGEYRQQLADGTPYCHVCPPLATHEIEQLAARGQLELTPAQTVDLVTGTLALRRDGHRDENLPSTKPRDGQAIKHEGAGVTVLEEDK